MLSPENIRVKITTKPYFSRVPLYKMQNVHDLLKMPTFYLDFAAAIQYTCIQ